MYRVITQEVGEVISRDKVIDRYDLHLRIELCKMAIDKTANSAKSIDRDFDTHTLPPLLSGL
jgi:hypothetical protein